MAHGSIDMLLSRISGDDGASQRRDPGGERTRTLKGVRQRLARDFTVLRDKAQTIHADKGHSEQGRRERVAALSAKIDLSYLDAMKAANEDDLQRYKMLLFTTPKSELDPALAFLREQEIRRAFADRPPHVIQAAYQDAVVCGDHERVRAMVNGPLGPMIDQDFQQWVQLEHAEKSQPALFANFQQATNLQEPLSSLHDHASQVLAALKDEALAPANAVA